MDSVVIITTDEGQGSGFFIEPSLLLTNRHVTDKFKSVKVKLRNGKTLKGNVVYTGKGELDLAVVTVKYKSKKWLRLAKLAELQVGDDVIAIGTPFGLEWSLSKGVISAIREEDGLYRVQTDAAINSGNSGGPLILASTGAVAGINTYGLKKYIAEGLNFAIASEELINPVVKYVGKKKGVRYTRAAFHANPKSKVFHKEGCRYYNAASCTVVFKTKSQAKKKGYKPCKICKP